MSILAIIVGLAGGFGAIGFRYLIDFFQTIAYGSGGNLLDAVQSLPWDRKVWIPAAGGLFVGPLVYFLAREAKGHGGLYCTTCHGSPHAMIPSTLASDNYQSIQYQNGVKSIGSCGVCHEGSKGEEGEIQEFAEKHGGETPEKTTACHLCHLSVSSDTTKWPHSYQWTNRIGQL